MVTGAAIAPTLAKNTEFIKFCHSLNSGYEGVSAIIVRRTDIPTLYDDGRSQILDLLAWSEMFTLGWNGFKREDDEHEVNFCEGSDTSIAFRKWLDHEGQREDQVFFKKKS